MQFVHCASLALSDVYEPNEEEIADADLFAGNVRKELAAVAYEHYEEGWISRICNPESPIVDVLNVSSRHDNHKPALPLALEDFLPAHSFEDVRMLWEKSKLKINTSDARDILRAGKLQCDDRRTVIGMGESLRGRLRDRLTHSAIVGEPVPQPPNQAPSLAPAATERSYRAKKSTQGLSVATSTALNLMHIFKRACDEDEHHNSLEQREPRTCKIGRRRLRKCRACAYSTLERILVTGAHLNQTDIASHTSTSHAHHQPLVSLPTCSLQRSLLQRLRCVVRLVSYNQTMHARASAPRSAVASQHCTAMSSRDDKQFLLDDWQLQLAHTPTQSIKQQQQHSANKPNTHSHPPYGTTLSQEQLVNVEREDLMDSIVEFDTFLAFWIVGTAEIAQGRGDLLADRATILWCLLTADCGDRAEANATDCVLDVAIETLLSIAKDAKLAETPGLPPTTASSKHFRDASRRCGNRGRAPPHPPNIENRLKNAGTSSDVAHNAKWRAGFFDFLAMYMDESLATFTRRSAENSTTYSSCRV